MDKNTEKTQPRPQELTPDELTSMHLMREFQDLCFKVGDIEHVILLHRQTVEAAHKRIEELRLLLQPKDHGQASPPSA